MNRRTLIFAGGAALAGVGGFVLTRPNAEGLPVNPLISAANAQSADPMAITDMVLGAADAPVEMIEYASFTCPHCANFHANQYPQLKANYIDTGKIRFVYREVYFDRFGLWASMVARCGGDAQFFSIANLIYEKQREWTASGDPATIVQELRKLAKIAGLEDAALDACLNDGAFAQSLVSWFEENADRDGISSTPSFLIDGEKYSNMGYDEFAAILDEKLGG